MKKLVLATSNAGKISEIKALLEGLSVEIVTLDQFPDLSMPEEDQPTFAGNAAKKAEAVSRACKAMALADDSGLEVDALNGRPGVRSARYAGEAGDYNANNRLLLEEMKNVPLEKRNAHFVCAIAISHPGRVTCLIEERCSGRIATGLQGSAGFGYDPLFVYEPAGVTFAQMSREEKNEVSHRGKALRRARKLIEELLSEED